MNPYIYLRVLKHASNTVFCVSDGQKVYWDPQFNCSVPYASGQQVKRSLLESLTDSLGVQMAPITFNYEVSKKNELTQKEPWSPCDPQYIDQLIGGWMRAGDGGTKKRRSPLSISSLHPLHPLLTNVSRENLTFDRSDRPNQHPVNVRSNGELLSEEEIEAFLQTTGSTLPRRHWIPDNKRATGLFVVDVAIDLRRLFAVSTNQDDPEIDKDTIQKLEEAEWVKSESVFGEVLILPKEQRDKVIPALAKALLNWRITSNQARTFSLMETLAIAISDNANQQAAAIRAKLIDDGEKPAAKPIVDENTGANLYVTLPCAAYIPVQSESVDALEQAEQELIRRMQDFDYEHQSLSE